MSIRILRKKGKESKISMNMAFKFKNFLFFDPLSHRYLFTSLLNAKLN